MNDTPKAHDVGNTWKFYYPDKQETHNDTREFPATREYRDAQAIATFAAEMFLCPEASSFAVPVVVIAPDGTETFWDVELEFYARQRHHNSRKEIWIIPKTEATS